MAEFKPFEMIMRIEYGGAVVDGDEMQVCCNAKPVAKLVRCKDCLYHTDAYPYDEEDELIPSNAVFCQHFEVIRDKDWFCADGERRTDEQQS